MRVAPLLLCVTCAACAGRLPPEPVIQTDLLSHLPRGEEQRERLCARGNADAVTAAFCGDDPPAIDSLHDVMALLGVAFELAGPDDVLPAFSLVAHSSALPARSVSAINPGVVIASLPPSDRPLNGVPGRRRSDGNVLAFAYARGDQVVEVIVTPPGGQPTFYLLRYTQDCGQACGLTELFTDRTERNWTGWSLYDDEDVKNSAFDCLHCHQTDGPDTPRIYRMQELENPWTHWTAAFTLSGRVLLDDTMRAHGDAATIAGVPTELVPLSDPIAIEDLIRFTDSPQHNVFPAPTIEQEVMASNPAQPRDNTHPGQSAAWQVIYDGAVRGDAIPPPYHDVKVTDPDRLLEATTALQAYLAGDGDVTLIDPREVFHAAALAPMSHRPRPGLSGREILVHACGQCHNDRLDQDLSRARFNALDLDSMTIDERELAVERMLLPTHDRYRMPPHLFRDLAEDEVERAVSALRDR